MTEAACLSPHLGNIFMVAEIEENIEVKVEERLTQLQVFDAPLKDIENWNHHLLKRAHLLVREQASSDFLYKFNHFLWI